MNFTLSILTMISTAVGSILFLKILCTWCFHILPLGWWMKKNETSLLQLNCIFLTCNSRNYNTSRIYAVSWLLYKFHWRAVGTNIHEILVIQLSFNCAFWTWHYYLFEGITWAWSFSVRTENTRMLSSINDYWHQTLNFSWKTIPLAHLVNINRMVSWSYFFT